MKGKVFIIKIFEFSLSSSRSTDRKFVRACSKTNVYMVNIFKENATSSIRTFLLYFPKCDIFVSSICVFYYYIDMIIFNSSKKTIQIALFNKYMYFYKLRKSWNSVKSERIFRKFHTPPLPQTLTKKYDITWYSSTRSESYLLLQCKCLKLDSSNYFIYGLVHVADLQCIYVSEMGNILYMLLRPFQWDLCHFFIDWYANINTCMISI